MARFSFKKEGLLSKKIIYGTTLLGALIFFAGGIIFWGGFNTAMEATNTMEFCISCHEMETNVYEEYKPTIHYSNRTGVRAGCPDCHVPDPWVHKMARKIQASNELYHKAVGTVDTPEKFNRHRLSMAKRVWESMKKTDSRECRNCHNFESMNPEFQQPRARKQHLNAFRDGQTCIDCHKGIAHKDVRDQLSDEELEALEAPNPKFVREVPQLYLDGLERITAKEEADAKAEADARKLANEQEQIRIAVAVEEALAANGANGTAANASGAGFGVDWTKAGSRDITIFYPGQTSIEWMLNGKHHGGARPFDKGGDRCTSCHDKETADMGAKIVSGEKAEETPIPGKRASIAVTVDATYDADNLYLKFTWDDDGSHVPVPFIDGGKMDPENPMKLAMMFADDGVEFADRAGCWGSCHHDAKNMPHAPAPDAVVSTPFADTFDAGVVTKYIKESRTKLEIKGRRGKKLGGWDKMRDQAEIDAAYAGGKYLDLVRYKSGTGEAEDGHIMENRVMNSGQGAEFDATYKNGRWTVVMKRPLKSDKPGDTSLDTSKVYNFGFAIHDDYSSSRFHHVSLGYKLGFDNAEAEINAVAQ